MSLRYAQLAKKNPKWSKRKILDALRPEYESPGRTKQEFVDSADINKILKRAQKTGTISHLAKYQGVYGDFADMPQDLFEARELLDRGKEVFNELPAEVRGEFDNDPLRFFSFANDPANKDKLEKVLPAIAEPGSYFLDARPSTPPGAVIGEGASPSPVEEPAAPTEAPSEPQS